MKHARVAVELLFLDHEWDSLDWKATAASDDLKKRARDLAKGLVQSGAQPPGVSAARDGSSITISFGTSHETVRIVVSPDNYRLFVERIAKVELELGDSTEATVLRAAADVLGLSGSATVEPLGWASGRDFARAKALEAKAKAEAEAAEVRS